MSKHLSGVSRRHFLAGGTALALAGGLSACGGPAPNPGGNTDPAAESGELTVVTPIFEGGDGKALLEKLISEFTAQHPKITVRPDYTSYAKLNEKLTTSITGGRPYDVMIMGVGWIPPFATRKVLLDLELDADELAKTYNPRVLIPGTYEDKVYGLPIMLDTRFGYYRKDFFDEAGLDPEAPPKDFAELREFAKALTRREGGKLTRAGFDFLSNDLRQGFATLMWAAGGEMYDADGKAVFNSAESASALQLMSDVVNVDKSIDFGFSEPGAATGVPIVQGRAAIALSHNNGWLEFEANAPELIKSDKIGMFVFNDKRPAMFQGGSMATVSARTKLPHAAKAFAQFLAGEQPALQASEQRGNVPAVTAAIESDYVKGNPAVQFAMANLDQAYNEGGVPQWLDVRGEFKTVVESVLLGQKSAQAALDELAAKSDAAGK